MRRESALLNQASADCPAGRPARIPAWTPPLERDLVGHNEAFNRIDHVVVVVVATVLAVGDDPDSACPLLLEDIHDRLILNRSKCLEIKLALLMARVRVDQLLGSEQASNLIGPVFHESS